jgi:hypothetical protein
VVDRPELARHAERAPTGGKRLRLNSAPRFARSVLLLPWFYGLDRRQAEFLSHALRSRPDEDAPCGRATRFRTCDAAEQDVGERAA